MFTSKRILYLYICMLLLALLAACAAADSKQNQAQRALEGFFTDLVDQNYAAAVDLYGGSYETLVSFNPDINPDAHVDLWRNGCQVNGLQCLTLRTVTFNEQTPGGEYIFTVEFNDRNNDLFIREACCGQNPATPPQFQFAYRVVQGGDGEFRVLDMPVYLP